MKAYWGSGGITPCILDFDNRRRRVVSFTRRPLYTQGKSPWYPLDRKLGGPQSRSGRGGEEKNSQPLPGLEPPIVQPAAKRHTTELLRLLLSQSNCYIFLVTSYLSIFYNNTISIGIQEDVPFWISSQYNRLSSLDSG
jgi:hypothetical protein